MSQALEDRFLDYAKLVRDFCSKLRRDVINTEYIRQLIRASSSVGANYIEASDDLGKLDEKMKIKLARREAKESVYWPHLVFTDDNIELENARLKLIDEGSRSEKFSHPY